jgi:hypothetical protein
VQIIVLPAWCRGANAFPAPTHPDSAEKWRVKLLGVVLVFLRRPTFSAQHRWQKFISNAERDRWLQASTHNNCRPLALKVWQNIAELLFFSRLSFSLAAQKLHFPQQFVAEKGAQAVLNFDECCRLSL